MAGAGWMVRAVACETWRAVKVDVAAGVGWTLRVVARGRSGLVVVGAG